MSRIRLGDNGIDVIVKMADGNPGAIQALMAIIAQSEEIDSQDTSGGIGAVLSLDMHQIYGTDIYILYNEKCQKDVRKLLVLLRACQLGIMPESKLHSLAGDRMNEIELADIEFSVLDAKVCEQRAKFQRPPAAAVD